MLEEKLLIMKHQEGFINFIESLKKVDPDVLKRPIDEGKWSILEIVAHFIAWDEFIIEKRLPILFQTQSAFEQAPDEQFLNGRVPSLVETFASLDIINRVMELRQFIYDQLDKIEEEKWLESIPFGHQTTSLHHYFDHQKDHDIGHIDQINMALNRFK